jgi:Receptor L domain
MFFNTRCLFALTALLALSANACSASSTRLARTGAEPLSCAGGVIQTADDAARFAGCTTINGDLQIANSPLSDLTALESLRNVSGALTVANNSELGDFTGLEQLTSVGTLSVHDNAALTDFSGLSALRNAEVVEIRRNPALSSVSGLEGLTRVEKLELVDDAVFDTAGLSGLREVGELTIAANPRLISLGGLNGLQRARSVQIRNNRVLCAKLGLLPQLGEVTDRLELNANRSVSNSEVSSLREHVRAPLVQHAVIASR